MSIFQKNFDAFCTTNSITYAELRELTELTSEELQALYEGKADKTTLYTFCMHAGIDIQSVYDLRGFVSKSIIDQYAAYPSKLKRMISKRYCDLLIKRHCAESESQFKMLLKPTKLGQPLLARILSGNSSFSIADFPVVFKGMSSVISEDDCKMLLGKCMYSLIPNWNLIQFHNKQQMRYPDIAKTLGISASTIGNWCALTAVPIPQPYWLQIAKHIKRRDGDSAPFLEPDEFGTTFIDPLIFEFKLDSAQPATNSKDDLADIFSTKPIKKVMQPKRNKNIVTTKHISSLDNLQFVEDNPNDQLQPFDDPIETHSARNTCEGQPVSIKLPDGAFLKMYNKLNETNKGKVNELITSLFFSQL